ncbi:MAG: amidophosphoribosyltransferase [Minwuia sp.]|uniref:amidophosphoribosyltransferase n=1 Tax=Minwuia sp. TaxID=2493630 RepID=UPI003A8596D7
MIDLSSAHPFQSHDDHFHEECAVFGVWGVEQDEDNPARAATITAMGLHALQHRGQEACGIVAFDRERFLVHRAIGLVGDVFGKGKADTAAGGGRLQRLVGPAAIGHTRYATSGKGEGPAPVRNIQPLWTDLDETGGFALAHNGNLTNANVLKAKLRGEGRRFQSTVDTEVILDLMARSRERRLASRLIDALNQVVGAYSIVGLSAKKLIGVRDPSGVRPLVLGRLDNAWIICSETCALDIVGATYVRDIDPGEMVVIDQDGLQTFRPFAPAPRRFCIFEYIYFSRPDSFVEGHNVYAIRQAIGRELAMEETHKVDMVIPIPDSGTPAAIGYAQQSGIPFELAVTRSQLSGRSFIEPDQESREQVVRRKLNVNRDMVRGKRVLLVDDSIVRGTTSKILVRMFRDAGVREVHMRIASPPTRSPCYYGVDTPSKGELIYNQYANLEQMERHLGVDSLRYLSVHGMYRAVGENNIPENESECGGQAGYCDACFTGVYPIELIDSSAERDRQKDLFREFGN